MLESSLDLLWIALALSALLLCGFLVHLIFNLTKVIRESRKTVHNVNKKLHSLDDAVEETGETMTEFNRTIQLLNTNILQPLTKVTSLVKGINKIVDFTKDRKDKREKKEE